MSFDFNGKRVYIAPHTPRTTMFHKSFCDYYPDATCLGFIDKVKEGDGIFRLEQIADTSFDAILILSQNHFDNIYRDYTHRIDPSKLIKVDILDNKYQFFDRSAIRRQKLAALPNRIRMTLLKTLIGIVDILKVKRTSIVFIAKSFVGTNTKMLYLHTASEGAKTVLLSDNRRQLEELRRSSLPAENLFSLRALWCLATAKVIATDQGNYTEPLRFLSPDQKTLQMWHGIPLKRMNRLTDTVYDWMVSPSDYVNDTSLSDVIVARKYLGYGYPRNDLLLKEHTDTDLIFSDRELYALARSTFGTSTKVIVYMPTHREASTEIDTPSTPLIPLDFPELDAFLEASDAILIVKLHPFVMQFFQSFAPEQGFKRIHFHSPQGDIYPILQYTDILITDYSSVYFDFLLLDRPIVFFDYDYDEYSGNMGGFVYEYEEAAPGEKVPHQKALEDALQRLVAGNDPFAPERVQVCKRFFSHCDPFSSRRIFEGLLK